MTVLIDLNKDGEVIKIKDENWTSVTFDNPPRFTAHRQSEVVREYQRILYDTMSKMTDNERMMQNLNRQGKSWW